MLSISFSSPIDIQPAPLLLRWLGPTQNSSKGIARDAIKAHPTYSVGDGYTFGFTCLLPFVPTFNSGALQIDMVVHGRTLSISHPHMQARVPAVEYEPIENGVALIISGRGLPGLARLSAH
ncbi:hypothetical protein X740_31525 [Mesorhizobium sp. LNHC221B00]|nr:hypothetical protein X740_31525 [Mesorhizobium sp. LNHC221B00]